MVNRLSSLTAQPINALRSSSLHIVRSSFGLIGVGQMYGIRFMFLTLLALRLAITCRNLHAAVMTFRTGRAGPYRTLDAHGKVPLRTHNLLDFVTAIVLRTMCALCLLS